VSQGHTQSRNNNDDVTEEGGRERLGSDLYKGMETHLRTKGPKELNGGSKVLEKRRKGEERKK